jgi:hypothetical protein
MGIVENLMNTELKVVELDGSEKTWIGGIYYRDNGSYLYTRCISKEAAESKEVKTVTLKETNGSYAVRYWTNLPEYWDNHAVVQEAPETLWEYDHYHDVFEHEGILDSWLEDDADSYWDDGYTEYSEYEFEEKCDQYVEESKEDCHEISFEDWLGKPVLTRDEWLKLN